jgi:hypothetical protein
MTLEPWEVNTLVMLDRTEFQVRTLPQGQPLPEEEDVDGDH